MSSKSVSDNNPTIHDEKEKFDKDTIEDDKILDDIEIRIKYFKNFNDNLKKLYPKKLKNISDNIPSNIEYEDINYKLDLINKILNKDRQETQKLLYNNLVEKINNIF
tara:strand:- start:546 stop:866 length:321 start_codon:yes stop_codon:yes gene_type:complete